LNKQYRKELIKSLKKYTAELLRHGEVVTGSKEEKKLLDTYSRILEESNPDIVIRKLPLRVLQWSEKESLVETKEGTIKTTAFPYTLTNDIEETHIFIGKCDDLFKRRHHVLNNIHDKIVSVFMPRDLDDVEDCYFKLLEMGVTGIIFIDFLDVHRRFVITGSRDYSYNMGAPPLIPVLHVGKSQARHFIKHSGEKIRIYTETIVRESTGTTLEGILAGRRDHEYVLLTTHHDHWFSGFHDNILGMAFIAMMARQLKNSKLERSLLLVSFTAEESGALGFAGWYWSYGSRSYASDIKTRSIDITAVVNVDMPGRSRICFSGTPEMRIYARKIAEKHGYEELLELEDDNPYMDSISFSTAGWPSASIHSLPYLQEIYHSSRDVSSEADWIEIWRAYEFYKEIVEGLSRGDDLPYSEGIKSIYDTYAELNPPIELLSILYKIYRATRTCGNKVIQFLYSKYYRAYIEVYKEAPTTIRSSLLPHLSLLRDIRVMENDSITSIPVKRYIIGYLEELPGLSTIASDSHSNIRRAVKKNLNYMMLALQWTLKLYVKRLANEIDELIGKACSG